MALVAEAPSWLPWDARRGGRYGRNRATASMRDIQLPGKPAHSAARAVPVRTSPCRGSYACGVGLGHTLPLSDVLIHSRASDAKRQESRSGASRARKKTAGGDL